MVYVYINQLCLLDDFNIGYQMMLPYKYESRALVEIIPSLHIKAREGCFTCQERVFAGVSSAAHPSEESSLRTLAPNTPIDEATRSSQITARGSLESEV